MEAKVGNYQDQLYHFNGLWDLPSICGLKIVKKEDNTIIIGASIGANLAIQFLMHHNKVKMAIALSPGLNYHDVLTTPPIQSLQADQKVILVASDDDAGSFEAIEKLHEVNEEQTVLMRMSGLGHGTTMFEKDSDLMDEIIKLLP